MRNKNGFTLLEIMIVLALLGGVGVVVMNLTKMSNQSTTKLQFDTDLTLITNEINSILTDESKCLSTLGATAAPASIDGKFFISSHASAPANGYGNSAVKINSYLLSGVAPDGILAISYINKDLLRGTSGPVNITKRINLYIEGSPGAITKCRALSNSTTDIWTHGTLTDSNNIYYNGGVRAGDETQTINCDVSTEGTQRYNKTTHAMEYCGYNAGPPVTYNWKPFINPGGCRFCQSCGGSWPVYAGAADTKDADWSGSEVLGNACVGALTYYSAGATVVARLCCSN